MPLIVKDEGEQAAVYINGSIADDDALVAEGYEFPRNVRKQLEACKGKKLTVYINSYGGSVAAGLAMANMIARHDKATTAIVEGVCCSIATQIFFSARKCKMPSNTFLMIHKPTSAVAGTADEMRKAAEALDAIQAGLETTYQSKALDGVTSERIHEMMNEETWLTGSEAATLFNIEVLSPSKAVNCAFPRGALKSTKVPASIKFSDEARFDEARKEMAEKIKEVLALAEGVLK